MAKHPLTLLYFPGLGDNYDSSRADAVKTWQKKFRINAQLVPMRWSDKTESYDQKFARALEVVDAVPTHHTLALAGESAGGSMVLALYAARKHRVARATTICGKNVGVENIGESYATNNPAFPSSVRAAESALTMLDANDRQRIHTIYSSLDLLVRPRDTLIHGTRATRLFAPSHMGAIVWVMIARPKLLIKGLR